MRRPVWRSRGQRDFQTSAEVDFLACVKLIVKTADLPECRGFAKDKGTGRIFAETTDDVPQGREGVGKLMTAFHFHGGAAEQAGA